MLIGLTLLILGVLTLLSIVMGQNLSGGFISGDVDGSTIVNGSTTTLEFDGGELLFNIDPTVATIAVFVIIGALAGVMGIQAVGSGLSPESIKIIMALILYGGIWALLSVLALPLISAIEVFGVILYMILLIGYITGVIQKISGGGVE